MARTLGVGATGGRRAWIKTEGEGGEGEVADSEGGAGCEPAVAVKPGRMSAI